jgi:FAD/FMN-containing dehydrogenase
MYPSNQINNRFQESFIKDFKNCLRGSIILPNDDNYDNARRVFNGAINKMPALIVKCIGVSDVINAVKFAREAKLIVAVRGGGHNVTGNSVCDGGIVIDLSSMKSIRVDPTEQFARAEGGTTWADFDHETQAYGLATTGGTVSSTGIAGLTLGGGIGWLHGIYGLTCDNLLAADVVTADAKLVIASDVKNQDLFWGLRGGGGNFGIVTSFKYKLHPVNQILGGSLIYSFEKSRKILRFFKEFTRNTPDNLTMDAFLFTSKKGVPMVSIDFCYAGAMSDGEKLIAPFRKFEVPLQDTVHPISYCELQKMFDNPFRAGQHSYWKSTYLEELSDDAIEVITNCFEKSPSKETVLFVEHYHGMMRRIHQNDTAFGHRNADYGLLIVSNWLNQNDASENVKWARSFSTAMQPFSNNTVYVNYLGEEGDEHVKSAYELTNYERLVSLKNKYDPENFFRLNHNIKPTTQKTT